MKRYLVKTLGCKANLADSQLIEAELQKRGWTPITENEAIESRGEDRGNAEDLLCVVNSCTVTDEADRQTRRLAARLARENPRAAIVVTGCGAEVDPERLARSKGISYVIGNRDKPRLVELLIRTLEERKREPGPEGGVVLGAAEAYEQLLSRHPMDREWPSVALPDRGPRVTSKTRAFLKIQEGCNAFCTYCVIPYGRGPSRSLRPRELVEAVRGLIEQGIREVVLTGTNIGDYGTDWGPEPALEELLRLIFDETALERLRVSSLDPTEITPGILRLMEREERLCPHFHVSLQSPHPRILKLMKRKYGAAEARACLEAIAAIQTRTEPVFVGMDVITGFPGESAEEFQESYASLAALPWSRLHVFPHSERAGTPATRLPGSVPQAERVRRARLLNGLSLERQAALHSAGARVLEGVLLERAKGPLKAPGRWVAGYTPGYRRVFCPVPEGVEPSVLRNRLITAQVERVEQDAAAAEVYFVGRIQ